MIEIQQDPHSKDLDDSNYEEVSTLIEQVKKIVKDKFGVDLETEIKIIGEK